MKKLFMLLATAAVLFFNANAQVVKEGIKVAQKGDFDLGLMIGVPPVQNANMPTISADLSWGLISGFINTKTFGQNGAIDLGVYYGITSYGHKEFGEKHGLLQNCILARGIFHFQFIENLDTYVGILSGVNLWSWSWEDSNGKNKKNGTDSKAVFGSFLGAKYYFTEKFGVKLEFEGDFVEGNIPAVATGVTFKFR